MRKTITAILIGAGMLLLAGCGSTAAPVAQTVTATATTTATTTSTLTPEPAGTVTEVATTTVPTTVVVTTTLPPPAPAVAFSDGTYIVGKDVQPGTYQAAAGASAECYWVRKKQAGDIIDNGFSTVFTIKASDYLVQTSRCGNWTKVG